MQLAQKLGFQNVYELPIAKTYVRHWGMVEGVREIIQNALDSDSPFEYEIRKEEDSSLTLVIRSRNAHLDASTLLLGQTTKADATDMIGSFGEGYKIAMLVLVRAGHHVEIKNGDRIWIPTFANSKKYNAEILCVEDYPADIKNKGIAFEIGGLTAGDIDTIRESCLQMQDDIGQVMETKYGTIMRNRQGKLYVGGLFICNTQLEFGYNINPEHIRLERDRQTVSTFDLHMLTKNMWFETKLWEEIAMHMEKEVPDLQYAEYGCPELVKEACYRRFKAKHPHAVIASTHDEMKSLVSRGLTDVVVVNNSYSGAVKAHHEYNNETIKITQEASPVEFLKAWFDDNRRHMRRSGIESFKDVIAKSERWINR